MSPFPTARSGLSAALACFVLALPGVSAAQSHLKLEPLDIATRNGERHFTVEVAETAAEQERGLMFRKHLAAGRGMLFDFHTPQTVSFWMKNTLIPLDIIFIDAGGRIVSIAANAKPLSEDLIPSGAPILGVLELRGGRAAEIGVQPGDRVRERMFNP